MPTKTWKLGEICKGGIIQVKIKNDNVAIIGKEWDLSQGTRKSSNQKNAKEWTRLEFDVEEEYNTYRKAFNFLHDLTQSWAAEEILKWIKENLNSPYRFKF